MKDNIFELSNEADVSGRRHVKVVLHEIYENNSRWNKNGISWLKEYTENNLQSISGMSLTAEFLNDEKDLIHGHGYTGIEHDLPLFENATVVGHFERGYIDEINIDGETKTVCIGDGIIDEMRYPKFVAWLEHHRMQGKVNGSVEIVGKKENHNRIIYDGGWKEEGRVPMVYDYSGYAVLGVMPADDSAVVMELNSGRETKKEGTLMDKEAMEQVISAVKQAVSEMNAANEAKEAEFNSVLKGRDDQIAELNKQIEAVRAEIASLKKERDDLAAQLETANGAVSEANSKIKAMEDEKAVKELDNAISVYSEAEQAVAKEEIDAYKANPDVAEINSIVGKICAEIVKNARANKPVEINSEIDIFGMNDSSDTNDDVGLF